MYRSILILTGLVAPLLLSCDEPPMQPSTPAADARTLDAAGRFTYAPRFDPSDFVDGVDNRFFPLTPGTRYVFRGVEDGEPTTDVVLVTHDRKRILGIEATVVLDRVYVGGELVERTHDWYAQDTRGNVWYLGEDSEELEDGEVVSTAGSWEAGVSGAEAGIIMPAHPQVGQHYRQEFLRGEAEDEARVTGIGMDIAVAYGSFHHCIRTVEFTRLEPGIKEAKVFCPRVGLVKAVGIEGEESRLVLRRVSTVPR